MIHLAVGSVYLQNNKIKDIKDLNNRTRYDIR